VSTLRAGAALATNALAILDKFGASSINTEAELIAVLSRWALSSLATFAFACFNWGWLSINTEAELIAVLSRGARATFATLAFARFYGHFDGLFNCVLVVASLCVDYSESK